MAKRIPLVAPNLLDKAFAIFSPTKALQRVVDRTKFEMAAGGYSGAKRDRASLANWNPGAGSPTADIIRDLPTLRGRSRDQMRTAPVAIGAINTAVSHVVGTGLSYTPAINAKFLGLTEEQAEAWQEDVKFRFDAWAGSLDCDLARHLNFYGIQELAFRSMLESGDTFVITPRVARPGKSTRLALQMVEADRVCNPNRRGDTDTMIDGVEVDETSGEAVAYHVAKKHPGDLRAAGNTWDRITVRGTETGRLNVIHLFKSLRPGQVRGVPWIAPILEPLKQLNRWTDAELNAAVISGLFAVFVKMDPDAFQDLFDDGAQNELVKRSGNWSGEMESGKAVNLLPGEEIQTTTPGRPNAQFDPFWQAIVRQIGMSLEIPFEVLVMHFQSSYSAARGAMLLAWKGFRSRRDFLSTYLCQPVFELRLADEVAEGRINAPGFFANDIVRAAWCGAIWTGDGPGSIDPVKEVTAAEKRVELGISTLEAESIQHDGIGWQSKHRQRMKEMTAQNQAGIYTPPVGTAVLPPTVPLPDPGSDDDTGT
jgi:lambda family phage portal protein